MSTETEVLAPRLSTIQIVDKLLELTVLQSEVTEASEIAAIDAEIERTIDVEHRTKLDALGWVVRKIDADVLHLKGEQERTRRRINALTAAKDRIRGLLLYAAKALDVPALRGRLTTATVCGGKASLVITNEQLLPKEFWTTRPVRLDALIKSELERGRTIPGARLDYGDDYIRISAPSPKRSGEQEDEE
jgi:hypothetical protein